MFDQTLRASEDIWLSTGDVARALGWDARTIRKYCDAGVIPCSRVGEGHRRVPRAWVDEQLRRLSAAKAH